MRKRLKKKERKKEKNDLMEGFPGYLCQLYSYLLLL